MVFGLFQKLHLLIYASQFLISKLFHFYLSFWIGKVWKGKKLQNFEYLENENNFLAKTVFEGLPFGEKIKNSGHER